MPKAVKGNVFPAAEKFLVNTFYNPVAYCIGRHMKEFPPRPVEQSHNAECFPGKHLLDGNKNLLGGFLHGKEKPAFVPDPFDIRIFHRTDVRVAQSCQTREQKAGKNLPLLFFHRVEIVLQKLIEHDQFLGCQAFPESFLRFHTAKAEQFLYGMFAIPFQASLSVSTYECLVYITEGRHRSIFFQCVQCPEIVFSGGLPDAGIHTYVREKVDKGSIVLVRIPFRQHRLDLVIVPSQIFFFPGRFSFPLT